MRVQNILLPKTGTDILANSTENVHRISQSEVKIACDGSTPCGGICLPRLRRVFSKISGMGFQPFTDFFIGFGGCEYERYWFTHVPQERVQKKRMNRSDQPSAAVIPATPDWMIRATAMMTPAISSATATLPFLSSSNAFTSLVSLLSMLMAR